jgi:flap endonuclease-1
MGLTDLRDLAEIDSIGFDDLTGSVVAVDFHNWLYRYMTIMARYNDPETFTTAEGVEVPNLPGIAKGLPKFYEHDLYPVFVFDGDVLELKQPEMERRKAKKQQASEELQAAVDDGDDVKARHLRARTQRLTAPILESSRELFELLDIPIVDAPGEAEAQAAYMGQQSAVDYVGTEDYDALLFGAPLTLRKLTSSGDLELMDFDATLAAHDITREQLVDIAILCGTDYNDGIHGVGPKTALREITGGKSAEDVIQNRNGDIPELDEVREIFLEPTVTDDYSFDIHPDPDFEGAYTYLVDTWEVPPETLETAFDRLENSLD